MEYPHAINSCCKINMYNKYNLLVSNPFDSRQIRHQYNPWCSNELILKDKELRCKANIQPLDISLDHSVSNNIWPY